MEVIVGEATEDTEILDARVDAEGVAHPNLGHNIRNIHDELLQVISDIKYGIQEFQGLLHQFSAIAEAQIQDELNAQEANDRRKQEIRQERQIRLEQDDGFQKQINDAAEAILRTTVTLRELSERRKTAITREESERISADDNLQTEINALAEAFLRDAANLHEALERRKEALKQEIQARIAGDNALQEQISRNAQQIQQETEQRFEKDAELHEAIDVLNEGVALCEDEINAEVQARAESD